MSRPRLLLIVAAVLIAATVALVVFVPAAQEAVGICPARAYAAETQPILRTWDDANKLASSTPRIQLAAQISRLQEIRRQAAAVTVYGCAIPAHTALLEMMDETIAGYTAFLSQQGGEQAHFTKAAAALRRYTQRLMEMRNA